MKISPECVPCLLNRLLYETNLVNPSRAEAVMKEACMMLGSDFSTEECSAELATYIHRRTYELLGCVDPYVEIKSLAMKVGLELEEKARSIIAQSSDKLHTAILVAIVGNVLDFGIIGGVSSPDELIASFDSIYREGLGYDDTNKLKKYLKKDAVILFFADNCGEIVFDKLLCKELKKFGVKIILVVKGEAILSDATLVEAEQIGMGEVVDEIITTEHYAVGLNVKAIGNELSHWIDIFDLIISKGMGNYEALSETTYKPIMHLLRTKCHPVAKSLGLPKDLNVAKLID